ncbi:hypothetical protein [Phyllobacterium ifriqiyense]
MNAAVAITTTAAQIQAILVVTSRLLFLSLTSIAAARSGRRAMT